MDQTDESVPSRLVSKGEDISRWASFPAEGVLVLEKRCQNTKAYPASSNWTLRSTRNTLRPISQLPMSLLTLLKSTGLWSQFTPFFTSRFVVGTDWGDRVWPIWRKSNRILWVPALSPSNIPHPSSFGSDYRLQSPQKEEVKMTKKLEPTCAYLLVYSVVAKGGQRSYYSCTFFLNTLESAFLPLLRKECFTRTVPQRILWRTLQIHRFPGIGPAHCDAVNVGTWRDQHRPGPAWPISRWKSTECSPPTMHLAKGFTWLKL